MSEEYNVDQLRKLVLEQQSVINALEKKVGAALKQAEAAENYSRQDCLIFRGQLNVRPNISLRDEMCRLIHHHTGVQFPPWCVNTAHWLGNGHSIIVRFNNRVVREEIYRNRVRKDPHRRGLFIHESLTESKMELVRRCSKLRTEGKASSYTQGGNVFVKRSRDSPPVLLSPAMTDDEILAKLANQPSSYRAAAARPAQSHPDAGSTTAKQQAQPQQDFGNQGQGHTQNSETALLASAREAESETTEEGGQQTNVVNQKPTPTAVTDAKVNNDQRESGDVRKNGSGSTGKGTIQKACHDTNTESRTQTRTRGASKDMGSLMQPCTSNSAQISRSMEEKKQPPQPQTDDSSHSSDSDSDHTNAQKPTSSLTHQPAGNECSVSAAGAIPDHTSQRKTKRGQKPKKK